MKSTLDAHHIHLASDGDVAVHAAGPEFWALLSSGRLPSLDDGRLLTVGESRASWGHYEMHPAGDEVVIALAGSGTLLIEADDGETARVEFDTPGQFAVVPRGRWHTLDTASGCRLMFVTQGQGTRHRPRDA